MSMSYRHVIEQPLDGNGNPYPGAKLFSYNTGGLVARTVYSDAALTIPITQPVIADSNGKFPNIFVQAGTYRYILKTSADVVITDQDNVDPGLSGSSGALPLALGGTGATTAAAARSNLGVPSTAVTTGLDGRVTAVEQTLAVPLLEPSTTVTYAASLALDFTTSVTKTITLTGNITYSAPTGTAGQQFRIIQIQDATGSRTWTFNSNYKPPGGVFPPASRTANAIDIIEGYFRTTTEAQITSIKVQDANGPFLSATAVTASGTSVDFTGIPSWVKRITASIAGISTSGSSPVILRLGAGGVATTGYSGASLIARGDGTSGGSANTSATATGGLVIHGVPTAASSISGNATFVLNGSNRWTGNFVGGDNSGSFPVLVSGTNITLAGTLDQVRLTTISGTDTFDAGAINLIYEG